MTKTRNPEWITYTDYQKFPPDEMIERARAFEAHLSKRRTIRDFEDAPVPKDVIAACIRTASGAPSGANMQPWHFCVITDAAIKHEIRLAAEEEERKFYTEKAPEEWLDALAPLGTDSNKGFLEHATLIALFAERYGTMDDGRRIKHYYVSESVGIATGFLITALHNAGLATLTHTPSPMNFLNKICNRPDNERPYILLVCGYPTPDAKIPAEATRKKTLEEVSSWF